MEYKHKNKFYRVLNISKPVEGVENAMYDAEYIQTICADCGKIIKEVEVKK